MKKRVFVLAVVLALLATLLTLSAFAADPVNNIRYVANAKKGTGDGLTAVNANTLDAVFTELNTSIFTQTSHSGETCTIYLVEDITLMRYRPEGSSSPKTAMVFSEDPHKNNPVTITTAPGTAKAAINFLYSGSSATHVYNYLCSGTTTFDNVIFSAAIKRPTGTSPQPPIIAAQGNKLTLGTGVATRKVVAEGDDAADYYGIGVVGVTYNSNTLRSTQGENANTVFAADLTVLGGEYEFIAAFSYSANVKNGSSAKLTLGNVKVDTLAASNYHSGTVEANTTTNVYYTGKVEAKTFWPTRRANDTHAGNASTFNHYLMAGGQVTFTAADIAKATNATLNLCVVPTDATAAKDAAKLYQLWDGNAQIGTFTFSTVKNDTTCTSHTETVGTLTEATCAAGGKLYKYCSTCCEMIGSVYDGESDATKHDIADVAWTVSDAGTTVVKVCPNCTNVAASYPVTNGKVAVYLSADGSAEGGESKENPVDTLRGAQNLAAMLADVYYGADDTESAVTIYVIGRVDMPSRILMDNAYVGNKVSLSTINQFSHCFEETAHIDHPFVFTSLEGATRGQLNFLTVDSASPTSLTAKNMAYMLYGPTTFENISFSAMSGVYNGVTYPKRQGHSIVARGFKLVLGEGITMIDNSGKMYKSGTSGAPVSDIKLYVVGGFYCSGSTMGDCEESKYGEPYSSDITVLSGEYWYIGPLNRNGPNITNTTAKLTLGSPKVVYLSSVSTGTSKMTNVRSDIIYTGALCATDIYFGAQNSDTGSDGYTCNHLFFPGSAGMSVTTTYFTYRDVINYYYADNTKSLAEGFAEGKSIDKVTVLPEYCMDFRNGHTVGANGMCSFCGITPCTTHEYSGFVYLTEATCTTPATGYAYCTVCRVRKTAQSVGTIDDSNHDYQTGDGGLVCTRCGGILSVSEPVVYVTNIAHSGTKDGKTAATAMTDFNQAYMLAISGAQNGKTTIYVVGGATIPLNASACYLEPEHPDVEVTIMGYGKSAAAFVFESSHAAKVEYGLNGPVIFDNIEIGSNGTSQVYFSARHNHLTIGKKVSMDFRRDAGGSEKHNGAVTVLGGCYSANFGTCTKSDTHLTLYNGTYRNVIAGSANRSCGLLSGKCILEICGDVSSREAIYGGSSGGDAGDVDIIINGGNAVANQYFSFGSTNGKQVGDVRVFLYSGSIMSTSFMISDHISKSTYAPIGSASQNASILAGKESLKVYYDPSEPTSVEMKRMIQTSANDGDLVNFFVIESVCTVNADGAHTHGDAESIETVAKTCYTDGYETYVCTACHREYMVSTGRAEHSFGAETTIPATCKDYGMKAKTCETCGFTQYTVDPSLTPDSDAHTLENGICTICHYSAAADCEHEWAEATVTEQTQCGTTVYKVCTKCDLREVVSTTGNHNWGPYSVTVEPTDTAPGTKTRKCKSCGKVETALMYPGDTSLATEAIAVDASGNAVGFSVESAKLSKSEKAVLNALLQDTAYGSEIKVSYTTDGTTITNVTYSIPVPDEYKDYENVKVVVKDDDGTLHVVDFKIEKGYIIFTF